MIAAGFERLADQVERWENASRRYHVGQMAPQPLVCDQRLLLSRLGVVDWSSKSSLRRGHTSERAERKSCEHNSDSEGQITNHVALRRSVHLALRFPRCPRGAST